MIHSGEVTVNIFEAHKSNSFAPSSCSPHHADADVGMPKRSTLEAPRQNIIQNLFNYIN